MAETILTSIAEEILSRVISLAAEEVSLAITFKADLQNLADRLKMIQAVLFDAETKQFTMESVRLWIKKLNAVAYDADVVLDEFTYELLRQKVAEKDGSMKKKVHYFFSPSTNPLAFRQVMAHKIRNVSTSLDKIYEEAEKIGLKILEVIENRIEPKVKRETHPYVDESEVVGRDKDLSVIVDTLVDSNDEEVLPVIAIIGMPGQGKTTLAQLVYKDETVASHFDQKIWMCVSDEFDVLRLLNQMVESLTGINKNISNIEGLIKHNLGEELRGKRFLLVLDDVWNEIPEKWGSLRNALLGIGGSVGSKVLVTTRSVVVASTMHSSLTHQLLGLAEDDSWRLFKRKAFADGGATENSNFATIGRELVKRCGGVPLAITALGGLLYSKKLEKQWLSIQNSSIWDTPENRSTGVLATLKLSYNNLPSSSLKRCFSYFSVFPKDTNLEKDKIIENWMALGLLNPPIGSELLMEDIGDSHFNTFLWNSLLQDVEKDELGKIVSCKMHDLVHDLAQQTAKDYWAILGGGTVNDASEAVQLSQIPTSYSIQESSNGTFHRLQTLYFSQEVSNNTFKEFKCLRVLILHGYRIRELPRSIGKLKHLRYLDIDETSIETLPDSICKLYNMQTLRVRYLDDLPEKIWNLINLRHFHFSSCWRLPAGVQHLTGLQTLPFFIVDRYRGCHIEELGSLNDLKGELTIDRLEDIRNIEEARSANLYKKSNIDELVLYWSSSRDEVQNVEHVLEGLEPHPNLKKLFIKNFSGCKFSSWLMMEHQSLLVLKSLVRIELYDCAWCEEIPTLGHLPNLKFICLRGMANLKHIGPKFYGIRDGNNAASSSSEEAVIAFPSLKELSLTSNECLLEWAEAMTSSVLSSRNVLLFPCLLKLEIQDCVTLKRIPNHFSSITELTVTGNKINLPLEDLLRDATSLQSLTIRGWSSLVSLPDLQYLTNLSELTIGDFSKDLDYFPWPYYSSTSVASSLRELNLIGWPKVKSLPEQLQHHSSLIKLSIREFDELEALPEWLGNLSSLQSLTIQDCKKVISMPTKEALQRLTKLQNLHILTCPRLKERCTEEGSGSEWEKIAHIPKSIIY